MGVNIKPQPHRYHGSGPTSLLARKSGLGYPPRQEARGSTNQKAGTLNEPRSHDLARPLQQKSFVRTRFAVPQAKTGDKAVHVSLFFVPLLPFALASSALAQVDRPSIITNRTDAPVQITEARCGQNAHGIYCQATLQFADTEETWDGYGLLWTITLEDGSRSPFRQSADRSIEPTGRPDGAHQPSARFFKPGEIVNAGNRGVRFGTTDRNGKTLHVTGTQVEVEFAIDTKGTVWGDSKSPFYLQIVANRKKAKEATR